MPTAFNTARRVLSVGLPLGIVHHQKGAHPNVTSIMQPGDATINGIVHKLAAPKVNFEMNSKSVVLRNSIDL